MNLVDPLPFPAASIAPVPAHGLHEIARPAAAISMPGGCCIHGADVPALGGLHVPRSRFVIAIDAAELVPELRHGAQHSLLRRQCQIGNGFGRVSRDALAASVHGAEIELREATQVKKARGSPLFAASSNAARASA
jgi:hypothetical protein